MLVDDCRVRYYASESRLGTCWSNAWINCGQIYPDQKLVQPRYQDVNSRDIPLLEDDDGSRIKMLATKGIVGPVDGITDPQYFDVYVPLKDKVKLMHSRTVLLMFFRDLQTLPILQTLWG